MMSYDLDAVYVVSLGILVGLITIPVRDWIDAKLATRGRKLHSFLWGWFAMFVSILSVVPVLLTKGATFNWRLLMEAYTEGLPVGAVAIVAYDLGIKPLKRFGRLLTRAIARWILSSMDKGGIYGVYNNESGGLGEEELEDGPGSDSAPGDGTVGGDESGSTPTSPP